MWLLALGCGPGTLLVREPLATDTAGTPTTVDTGEGCQPCTIVEGGIVPFLPGFSATPAIDRRDVVETSSVAGAGRLSVSLQNPSEETRLPSSQAVWEVTLQDLLGRSIDDADALDLDDLVRVILGSEPGRLPDDVVISAGLSAGPVSTSNPGVAVQLEAAGEGNRVQHAVNAGSGWSISTANQVSGETARALLQVTVGTDDTQGRVSAFAWNAERQLITTASVHTSPATSNVGGDFDRIFLGVGWAEGNNRGDPVTIEIGCGALLLRPREIAGFDPFGS